MISHVILSFVISLSITPLAIYLGKNFGIVDRPDGKLKTHQKITPYLGGLAIYAGVLPFVARDIKILILLSVMFLLGLLDDTKQLPWYFRLIVEFAVGVFLSTTFTSQIFQVFLFTFLFVLIVNATNMIDGMDGICATLTIVGMIFSAEPTLRWALLGSVGGFLVFNFPPAKIFMGDAGSYVIGFSISCVIFSNLRDSLHLSPFLPFWVFFLDIFGTVIRRLLAQRSPFYGDRDHIYDKIPRRVRGSKLVKDRKTLLLVNILAVFFGLLRYLRYGIFIALIASVVVLLFLRIFWYDEGGKIDD
ncbi:glycosyltransferase family 4 protein [Pseudothermotoga sp. U03pept]|uniref:glycosyltransferase family 4 protein n=1 Tax=Pseudothermotoga sp. U03pept TaxID=3447012 RepID=UPI003F1163C7